MMDQEVAQLRIIADRIATTNSAVINASGTAIRELRETTLEAALGALMELADVTSNWAADIPGQVVLYRLVTTQPYKLRQLTQSDRLERMRRILVACEEAGPGIAGNPLNTEHYRNANACLQAYEGLAGAARNSDGERTAAVAQLKSLFKEAREMLGRIDRMMRKFKTTHPELHAHYKSVRNIIDIGGRTEAPGAVALRKAQLKAEQAKRKAEIAAEKARLAEEAAFSRRRVAELRSQVSKDEKEKKKARKEAARTKRSTMELPVTPPDAIAPPAADPGSVG